MAQNFRRGLGPGRAQILGLGSTSSKKGNEKKKCQNKDEKREHEVGSNTRRVSAGTAARCKKGIARRRDQPFSTPCCPAQAGQYAVDKGWSLHLATGEEGVRTKRRAGEDNKDSREVCAVRKKQ